MLVYNSVQLWVFYFKSQRYEASSFDQSALYALYPAAKSCWTFSWSNWFLTVFFLPMQTTTVQELVWGQGAEQPYSPPESLPTWLQFQNSQGTTSASHIIATAIPYISEDIVQPWCCALLGSQIPLLWLQKFCLEKTCQRPTWSSY